VEDAAGKSPRQRGRLTPTQVAFARILARALLQPSEPPYCLALGMSRAQ
jgi:hypothetical protein